MIGPNGAGKSTLLRALAGLVPLTEGHVGAATARPGRAWRRPLRPRTARVGLVFQDHLLFPHLTALDNVAFGPRSRGTAARPRPRRTRRAWLDRLGVGDLADRRPRAAVRRPGPAGRDRPGAGHRPAAAAARRAARRPRRRVAMALRLELGRHLAAYDGVTAAGHPRRPRRADPRRPGGGPRRRPGRAGRHARRRSPPRPRTDHVARLVGLNVLRGEHGTRSGCRRQRWSPPRRTATVHACFTPAAVTLAREPTGWPATGGRTVVSVAPHGDAVRVHLDAGRGLIADVTPASAGRARARPGPEVWAAVKATEVPVYAAATPRCRLPLAP